jgi:hypothetical protein
MLTHRRKRYIGKGGLMCPLKSCGIGQFVNATVEKHAQLGGRNWMFACPLVVDSEESFPLNILCLDRFGELCFILRLKVY